MSDAVKKLGIDANKKFTAEEKLNRIESGEDIPSRSILSKMAASYRRPLLTFYLPNVPLTADRGEDFRTLPEPMAVSEMAQIDALVRNVKVKQELIKAALIDEDEAEPLALIGSVSVALGVGKVAAFIANKLEIRIDKFRSFAKKAEAFNYLRNVVEERGIFVLLKGNLGSYHTDIDVNAFRGFALADEIAPFIVINDHDSKAAWCFTLLHEVVHLFLGKTGISAGVPEQAIEKFCSDVASQILLPLDEVGPAANFVGLEREELVDRINLLARTANVSRALVTYRLHRLGVFDFNFYQILAAQFRSEWQKVRDKDKAKYKEQDGGPHPYILGRHKLGASLVNLVERLNESGTLPVSKAALVLGVKPLKVYSFLSAGRAA